jgi:hypothetical protein
MALNQTWKQNKKASLKLAKGVRITFSLTQMQSMQKYNGIICRTPNIKYWTEIWDSLSFSNVQSNI